MTWNPIETAPRDGSFFVVWNGDEMAILNWPEGCLLGRWHKRKGGWSGSSVLFPNPTHWMKRPQPPKKGDK